MLNKLAGLLQDWGLEKCGWCLLRVPPPPQIWTSSVQMADSWESALFVTQIYSNRFVDLPSPVAVVWGVSEQSDDSLLSRSSPITLLLAAGKDGGAGGKSISFTNLDSVFCIWSTLISSWTQQCTIWCHGIRDTVVTSPIAHRTQSHTKHIKHW